MAFIAVSIRAMGRPFPVTGNTPTKILISFEPLDLTLALIL